MHPAPASRCECPVCDLEFTRSTAGEIYYHNAFLAMSAHVKEKHPEALVSCPRKDQEATLEVQRQAPVFWEKDHTCSYCGSLSPEALFEAIDKGYELGPTDKSYKLYVELPHPQAGQEWPLMTCSNKPGDPPTGDQWIPVTDEMRKQYFIDEDTHWVGMYKIDATDQAKFYFQHFNDEHKDKFIALYNEKKLKIGYPNYFYVMPFFMQLKKPAS